MLRTLESFIAPRLFIVTAVPQLTLILIRWVHHFIRDGYLGN